MRHLIALFALSLALPAQANPLLQLTMVQDGPAGGPDVWYDITTTSDGARTSNTTKTYYQTVTVAQAGTATKIRWYCHVYWGGSESVKVALYSAGGALMSSGAVTVNGTGSFEATLAVPQAVTATTYIIATSFVGGSVELGKEGGVGTHSEDGSGGGYAAFPFATLPAPTATPSGSLRLGLYVD